MYRTSVIRYCQRDRVFAYTVACIHTVFAPVGSASRERPGFSRVFIGDTPRCERATLNRPRSRPLSRSEGTFTHGLTCLKATSRVPVDHLQDTLMKDRVASFRMMNKGYCFRLHICLLCSKQNGALIASHCWGNVNFNRCVRLLGVLWRCYSCYFMLSTSSHKLEATCFAVARKQLKLTVRCAHLYVIAICLHVKQCCNDYFMASLNSFAAFPFSVI